jgi:hypothetical protein
MADGGPFSEKKMEVRMELAIATIKEIRESGDAFLGDDEWSSDETQRGMAQMVIIGARNRAIIRDEMDAKLLTLDDFYDNREGEEDRDSADLRRTMNQYQRLIPEDLSDELREVLVQIGLTELRAEAEVTFMLSERVASETAKDMLVAKMEYFRLRRMEIGSDGKRAPGDPPPPVPLSKLFEEVGEVAKEMLALRTREKYFLGEEWSTSEARSAVAEMIVLTSMRREAIRTNMTLKLARLARMISAMKREEDKGYKDLQRTYDGTRVPSDTRDYRAGMIAQIGRSPSLEGAYRILDTKQSMTEEIYRDLIRRASFLKSPRVRG